MENLNPKTVSRALALLNPRKYYHRAEILHEDRFPLKGGAIIVSNHGRLDFDSFILARLILKSTGRLARLMTDSMWFKLPIFSKIFPLAGAVEGTRENALNIINNEEMVLTYPGGVREILNSRFGHEYIDWEGRTGFAKVAIAGNVPVIPIVGIGVNNGFLFLSSGRLLGKILYRHILRLGPEYDSYRDPLALGIIPLPLPYSFAINFPFPCKIRYIVGKPIFPDSLNNGGQMDAGVLADRVADSMREMIQSYGRPILSG